ncbi:antA/AntB antirepressor family protein [Bacillus cereus group sp. N28]|nr:antA/AntB antirepressor family protein [Bacillus cereus group sp. N28]
MEGYGFIENDDFITVTKKLVSGGKASEHLLKIMNKEN